ncbi:ABC transporter substrate-binding protein [Dactylosporangium matsuzakiense]|uniref:ABC transporter substrate-binding protein n=2 Tax=Dactylosporangium matsuzakiense TaxID=53360 RepID=A0A9W6KCF3_9ACTN|nr:ABC transporter substrate-binding protein [Dactylosporangium matsuzakiense]UWZ47239.1 ABC transporter substrate-binding protein [Dactylosporangium matsuzakiense]GLK98311.1 ABC transporter substrate-binding protein [Dactylosporangium matsuzakiense]
MALTVSRRGLLAGVLGLGALAACGDGTDPAASGAGGGGGGGGGPFAFTDDRGTAVNLGATPKRVVAYVGTAAALHDFGVSAFAGTFGPLKAADGGKDPLAGGLDPAKVESLGNAWGEFNIEKYAALRPELLITNMYEGNQLWYVPEDSKDKILGLAPSIGLTVSRTSLATVIQRYADLAKALGGDPTAGKAQFDTAAAAVRAAVKASGGLKVLAASASPDLLYVCDPKVYGELSYYRELGVEVIAPTAVSGGYFENLSWENADKYKADVILLDNRSQALQPKDLAAKPTWASLPAVKAAQIVPWQSEPRFSYTGCAGALDTLAKALSGAKKVTT